MANKINRHKLPSPAKMLKGVKTLNDLMARDDVNGILQDLDIAKPNITDLVVVYIDRRDKKYRWQATEDTLTSTAVWLLECAKQDFINIGNEDD